MVGGFDGVYLVVRSADGTFVVGIAFLMAAEVLLEGGSIEGVLEHCVIIEENEAAFGTFSLVYADG